jgi:hypothetical protein
MKINVVLKRFQGVFLVLMVASLLLGGCRSPSSLDGSPSSASLSNPDGSPSWTTSVPSSATLYFAIGYGRLSNEQNSFMRAEALAKDRIGWWASTKVQRALTNYFQDSGVSDGQTVEMLENISRQIVDESINVAVLVERYVAPDGSVWVLYSYSLEDLKDAYLQKSEELDRRGIAVQTKLLLEYLETEMEINE